MNHPSAYAGRPVVVLGLARSGVAVAKLFHAYGANVTVNDQKPLEQCPEAAELTALGISVVCGGHPPELIHPGVSLVVKNPGIPYKAAPVARALELGIEVVTEIEVAYRVSEAPIIGITGSNGKTTTTTWIGEMLREAGLKPVVAGNIGTPLCEAAPVAKPGQWIVAELSSFQLKGTADFRPRIALLLNVYETHLDYHGTMDDYIESKAKLFARQRPDDIALLNADDPVCRRLAESVKGRLVQFSVTGPVGEGVYLDPPLPPASVPLERETLLYRDKDGAVHELLKATELGIPGRYNIENAAAAAAAALSAGAGLEAVRSALREFRGVEHRLEFVAERNRVVYYNNSKATNSAATIRAMEGFDRPIVLVAGGQDRGLDFLDMLEPLAAKVRGLVAIGQTRDILARVAARAGVPEVRTIETTEPEAAMREAVRAAAGIARPGDAVLLSPACASWDMYRSYEERGRMFKESVHTLE